MQSGRKEQGPVINTRVKDGLTSHEAWDTDHRFHFARRRTQLRQAGNSLDGTDELRLRAAACGTVFLRLRHLIACVAAAYMRRGVGCLLLVGQIMTK
jgi:hypothetical protein